MIVAEVGQQAMTLDMALLELVRSGEWASFRADLTRSHALEAAVPEEAFGREARDAEVAFRRARGLLAGEELQAWLAARGTTVSVWRRYVRRRTLLEMVAEASIDDPGAVGEAELREEARIGLLVGGSLKAATQRLLMGAAALEIEGEDPQFEAPPVAGAQQLAEAAAHDDALPLTDRDLSGLAEPAATVLALGAARQRIDSRAGDREVRLMITERQLDWTRFDVEEITLETASAAREAVLCVRDDGLELAEVGRRAERPTRRHTWTAVQAGTRLAGQLMAATPGTPVGPLADGDTWRVVVVRARLVPDEHDPTTWAHARAEVAAEMLTRRLAGKVRFHADL